MKMKFDRRTLGFGAAGVIVVAVLVWTVRDSGVVVDVDTVARDTLSVTVSVEGRTRARELFTVTAPAHGRVARIDLREGFQVEAGDIVARILPSLEDARTVATLRADVEAARAARLEAEAAWALASTRAEQARREAERREALADEGSLSREAIEQARAAAEVAGRSLEAARAALESSEARLTAARARLLGATEETDPPPELPVTAPVDGRVLRIPERSARSVTPGTPLVELADVRGLEVVFDVLSEDAVRVEPGQEIRIRQWGGDTVLTGRVRTVTMAGYTKVSALGVEEQRVDVIGDLDDTPATLGAEYRVGGDIVVWRGEGTLTVPTSAVFRSGDGWSVFVVEGERARIRRVVLGRRNAERAEVLDGLAAEQEVVVFPPAALTDGAKVRVGSGDR